MGVCVPEFVLEMSDDFFVCYRVSKIRAEHELGRWTIISPMCLEMQ